MPWPVKGPSGRAASLTAIDDGAGIDVGEGGICAGIVELGRNLGIGGQRVLNDCRATTSRCGVARTEIAPREIAKRPPAAFEKNMEGLARKKR